ncbi:hypothetical protein APR50_23065 [Variovorax paradoxus]|nr:hypothetical protein APR50_23065 [Variovorax paradoxus]KPV08123.1 hypothetical protein APR49_16315 [Variovorax paradoxus]KPV35343.1 hypothetical protein APR48_04140 [Variovorax paradoxus]
MFTRPFAVLHVEKCGAMRQLWGRRRMRQPLLLRQLGPPQRAFLCLWQPKPEAERSAFRLGRWSLRIFFTRPDREIVHKPCRCSRPAAMAAL